MHGVWFVVCSIWCVCVVCVVCSIWCVVCSVWHMLCCVWCAVYGACVVCGVQYMVYVVYVWCAVYGVCVVCGGHVDHCRCCIVFEVLYLFRWGYQKRKAYKEDPYVFVEKDGKLWQSVKYVFGLEMIGGLGNDWQDPIGLGNYWQTLLDLGMIQDPIGLGNDWQDPIGLGNDWQDRIVIRFYFHFHPGSTMVFRMILLGTSYSPEQLQKGRRTFF